MRYTASFSKLRDGAWGVKVKGLVPDPGDEIEVTKKDGTKQPVTIARVLWHEGRDALCSVEESRKRSPGRGGYRPQYGRDYCGGRCPVDGHRCTADNPCHDCQ